MINTFLILHGLLAIVLIIVILLQRSDGGALGGLGGGGSNFSGMLSGRGSATLLTKITAVVAALFLANSLFLAILSGNYKKKSIIEDTTIEDLVPSDKSDKSKPIVPDSE